MTEEATLLVISNVKDSDGFPIEQRIKFPVFVSEKSLTRYEFYEAYRSGIKAAIVLELRLEDWEQAAYIENGKKYYATRVLYDGAEYEIVRSYMTNKSKIQITCS